jgi:hypothetical protein
MKTIDAFDKTSIPANGGTPLWEIEVIPTD